MFNEHGNELISQEIVEYSRAYTVQRRPSWSREKFCIYVTSIAIHALLHGGIEQDGCCPEQRVVRSL